MAKSLTVKAIEALEPAPRRLEIGDGGAPGLYLVVQPTGARSWSVRYRSPLDGKPKKYTIGPYPSFGLAEARKQAMELRLSVGRGIDPAEVKRKAKKKAADTSSEVGQLLDVFLKRHADAKKASTAKLMRQQAETELRPAWGSRRVEALTRQDIIVLLEGILDRGASVQANRIFSLVRKFLNWCVDRGVIERSPAAGMKRPANETARTRVLSENELRWLWAAAGAAGNFGACVKLLLLTGQRRMEVGGICRSEIGGSSPVVWTIPSTRTKNGREHMVPLTETAIGILNCVAKIGKADLIFTTNGSVASSGWSKSKVLLDSVMREEASKDRHKSLEVEIAPWTIHDLRRTFASGLARLRQSPHVIEALLNHKTGQVSGLAAVYNRWEYRDEKLEALQVWERYLLSVCDPRGAINVVPLRAEAVLDHS